VVKRHRVVDRAGSLARLWKAVGQPWGTYGHTDLIVSEPTNDMMTAVTTAAV
jgi:hypothetical protein